MTEQSFRPAHMRADGTPIHTAKIHTSKIHTASCFRTWDSASWMAWATCVAFSMYTTWPISGDSIYTIVRSINCNILESWANLGLSCTTIYITLGQSHATYDRGLNSGQFQPARSILKTTAFFFSFFFYSQSHSKRIFRHIFQFS
jgi:hypothetical protein